MLGRGGLIILDDIFPAPFSPFRIAEYSAYLAAFDTARVLSRGSVVAGAGDHGGFDALLKAYGEQYPALVGRVAKFRKNEKLRGRLAYTVFLNNIHYFNEFIERARIPFVFTLYPGGGFRLHEAESVLKLKRVCASPHLRGVIATQKVTRDYLVDEGFLPADRVELIYGCVIPSRQLDGRLEPRKYYPTDKSTFDICFVAYKYMARGADKGYDVFVDVARQLARRHEDVRFHVVGPYGPYDVDLGEAADRFSFCGVLPTEAFPSFYAGMDMALSPNAAFTLAEGAFDGFPTASCIEAGYCGVPVFASDPLGSNIAFHDRRDIVIINRNADDIADLVSAYRAKPESLVELSRRGQAAFREVFNEANQMTKRMEIISQCLEKR